VRRRVFRQPLASQNVPPASLRLALPRGLDRILEYVDDRTWRGDELQLRAAHPPSPRRADACAHRRQVASRIYFGRSDKRARAWPMLPSGASTQKHEALELRDEDPRRFHGRGVRAAVENVEVGIAPALEGYEATDQAGLDSRLVALDGTREKRRLGANALLGV